MNLRIDSSIDIIFIFPFLFQWNYPHLGYFIQIKNKVKWRLMKCCDFENFGGGIFGVHFIILF